jgi:outer membrane protein OmpA-like peptidoglycan-associated protein
MNIRKAIISLPLAAVIAVPAFAQNQQATSTSTQATPTQTQADQKPQSDNLQSTQTATATESSREPLKVESKEGFWGKLNPFARKKYVRRQMEPVVGRVNELDELTASNSKMIRDVDTRATEGIRLASAKANEADQHAVDAGNRAAQAQDTAMQANNKLVQVEKVVTSIDQYQPVTSAEIRFKAGQSILSKKAKEALDQIAEPMKDQNGYVIEVQGFSAGSGSASVAQSQKMADSVVRYLVLEHNIPVYRIFTVGMGNAAVKTADGSKPRRVNGGRVEINLMRNGISELAQGAQQVKPGEPAAQPQSLPQNDQNK